MAEKKANKKSEEAVKKPTKKASSGVFKITKANGNVIKRFNLTDALIKNYEAKGMKVEEE